MDNRSHGTGGQLGTAAFIAFLVIGGFLLIKEHRAHIFTGNWFLWLLPLGCIFMHLFHGHGGHGGHGDKSSRDQE